MAKDPAFLFYPGDYLRDTQNLSEKAQVAYDRIMCEHMRNICITQQQLNFFIKRLSDDEKAELFFVLTKIDGGYQIEWIAESIEKRRAYSKSRRENRSSSNKHISKTYDSHMENENVIENNIEERKKKFLSTLDSYKNIYHPELLIDFYEYWTEPNRSGTKFRQESEKTWDLNRRLKTWDKNNFNKDYSKVNKPLTEQELYGRI